MTPGQIDTSVEFSKKFLTELDLLKNTSLLKGQKKFITDSDSLKAAYEYYTKHFYFKFLLEDDSIFIFDHELNKKGNRIYSYTFIGSLLEFTSYSEFLVENDLDESQVGDSYRELYDQFLLEEEDERSQLYIRYDLDVDGRTAGLHPASHIHIGLENEIRIPVSLSLTPLMFCCFVVKQVYPEKWKKLLSTSEKARNLFLRAKRDCAKLHNDHFNSLDTFELFLS